MAGLASTSTAGTRAERKKGCLDLLPIEPLYREYAARIEKIARRMTIKERHQLAGNDLA